MQPSVHPCCGAGSHEQRAGGQDLIHWVISCWEGEEGDRRGMGEEEAERRRVVSRPSAYLHPDTKCGRLGLGVGRRERWGGGRR